MKNKRTPIIIGQKYNHLTVISLNEAISKIKDRKHYDVMCDCRDKTIKVVAGSCLNSGRIKSCGCLIKENIIKRNKANAIHGKANTPIWESWQHMKQRCLNPNSDAYKHYGGRGITICDRWLGDNGFINFLEDMGERPKGKTLDRINPNGNYTPDNCRWATPKEQNKNKRIHLDKKNLQFIIEPYYSNIF